MLDTCITGLFILDDIATTLGSKGVNTQLMVKTVNGTELHDSKVLNGLIVAELKGENPIQLLEIFKRTSPHPKCAYTLTCLSSETFVKHSQRAAYTVTLCQDWSSNWLKLPKSS